MLKTKRTPDDGSPGRTLIRSPRIGPTQAQLDARDQLRADAQNAAATKASFAARFAKQVQKIGKGVTIGIDKDLKVSVIQKATDEQVKASWKGHGDGRAPIADGLDDPRLRDLDATVRQFLGVSAAAGVGAEARARFAASMLGVTA
jgi:hypothetical protein